MQKKGKNQPNKDKKARKYKKDRKLTHRCGKIRVKQNKLQ